MPTERYKRWPQQYPYSPTIYLIQHHIANNYYCARYEQYNIVIYVLNPFIFDRDLAFVYIFFFTTGNGNIYFCSEYLNYHNLIQ